MENKFQKFYKRHKTKIQCALITSSVLLVMLAIFLYFFFSKCACPHTSPKFLVATPVHENAIPNFPSTPKVPTSSAPPLESAITSHLSDLQSALKTL